MNPATSVLRWYRQSASVVRPAHRYTTEEVLSLLRPRAATYDDAPSNRLHDARTTRQEAVRLAAARPDGWAALVTWEQRRDIGGLADRLPTLVSHYASGGASADLLQRYGGWSTWRYERALDVAGACIARYLNAGRAA